MTLIVQPDYSTAINREYLETRLSCFGSEYKNGRTFYSFHEEEIGEILAKRQCSKNSKKTIQRNNPLSPKLAD